MMVKLPQNSCETGSRVDSFTLCRDCKIADLQNSVRNVQGLALVDNAPRTSHISDTSTAPHRSSHLSLLTPQGELPTISKQNQNIESPRSEISVQQSQNIIRPLVLHSPEQSILEQASPSQSLSQLHISTPENAQLIKSGCRSVRSSNRRFLSDSPHTVHKADGSRIDMCSSEPQSATPIEPDSRYLTTLDDDDSSPLVDITDSTVPYVPWSQFRLDPYDNPMKEKYSTVQPFSNTTQFTDQNSPFRMLSISPADVALLDQQMEITLLTKQLSSYRIQISLFKEFIQKLITVKPDIVHGEIFQQELKRLDGDTYSPVVSQESEPEHEEPESFDATDNFGRNMNTTRRESVHTLVKLLETKISRLEDEVSVLSKENGMLWDLNDKLSKKVHELELHAANANWECQLLHIMKRQPRSLLKTLPP